jgi:hypothetical protein
MQQVWTAIAGIAITALAGNALAQGTLRIGMTASDIPTTTGMPNNGFEGMRFLGYPIFEGLVLWDLASADRLAGLRPGLAERYEQAEDKKTWIFHLRHGVKFHDGTDFNADAVIWNLDRFFKNDSPQFEPGGAGFARARVPNLAGYRKLPALPTMTRLVQPAIFPVASCCWPELQQDWACRSGPVKEERARAVSRRNASLISRLWSKRKQRRLTFQASRPSRLRQTGLPSTSCERARVDHCCCCTATLRRI